MLIEMKVMGLSMDPMTELPILILKNQDEKSALPIWIGLIEAGAIATELEKIKLARPMTHDLIINIMNEMNAKLDHVEITDLHETTYLASLFLRHDDKMCTIDARPSDAIALALRADCPILVAEDVIRKSREVDLRAHSANSLKSNQENPAHFLTDLPEAEFGKWKM